MSLHGDVVKYLKVTLKYVTFWLEKCKIVKVLVQHICKYITVSLYQLYPNRHNPWYIICASLQAMVWMEEWPPPVQERRTSPTETGGTTRREGSSPKWPQTSWERGSSSIYRWENFFTFLAHQSEIITGGNIEIGQ